MTGIPFVRTSSLINYGIDPFPDHYASDELTELFDQPVYPGDILVSMEGKIGQVAYLTQADNCVFKNHIELVRCHPGYNSMFLFLFLSSKLGKSQIDKQTVIQATIPGLGDRLRNVLVPITPKKQTEWEDFHSKVDRICAIGYEAAGIREEAIMLLRQTVRGLEEHILPQLMLKNPSLMEREIIDG
jgi:restriction endonuclease S subunit